MIYRKILSNLLTSFCSYFLVLDMPTEKYFSCYKKKFDFVYILAMSFLRHKLLQKIN